MPKRRVRDPENPPLHGGRFRSDAAGARGHTSCGRRGISTISWATEEADEAPDQSPGGSGRARGLPRDRKGVASEDE